MLNCKVPDEGLGVEHTIRLEQYVELRAKLTWAQQLEDGAQHVPLLGTGMQSENDCGAEVE